MEIVFKLNLRMTDEDKEQVTKLTEAYFRKRANYTNSSIENLAGALLWVYSRINFLFNDDEDWSQKNLANTLSVKSKTISNISSKIIDSLNIDMFDSRFARKEVADSDPRNDFFMLPSGFIAHKNDIVRMMEKRINEAENIPLSENEVKVIDIKNIKENKAEDKGFDKNKKLSDFFR